MKPLTAEWVSKAEGDYNCVLREWRARKNPNYDALCFHAQQCAEKYLKACLQERGIRFDRTHNLNSLLDLLLPFDPLLEALRESLLQLTVYAVAFRYPGESAIRVDARQALALCTSVRAANRRFLFLPSVP
jgi:HEPN domain-containing protein